MEIKPDGTPDDDGYLVSEASTSGPYTLGAKPMWKHPSYVCAVTDRYARGHEHTSVQEEFTALKMTSMMMAQAMERLENKIGNKFGIARLRKAMLDTVVLPRIPGPIW